jgi:superfamily II DNA or RNA helicase
MRASPSICSYDHDDLAEFFDPRTLTAAQALVHGVLNLACDADMIFAEVKAPGKRAHEVDVIVNRRGSRLELDGDCTCHGSLLCVHMAAVLLAHLGPQPGLTEGVVRPELVRWLEALRTHVAGDEGGSGRRNNSNSALAYVLRPAQYGAHCQVDLFKCSRTREGSIRTIGQPWSNVEGALQKPPQFVDASDLAVLRLLWFAGSHDRYNPRFVLSGPNGAAALELMLATGRLFAPVEFGRSDVTPLHAGPARPSKMLWDPQHDDRLRPRLQTEPSSASVILTEPAWYIDSEANLAGVAELPWAASWISEFMSMPAVSAKEAPAVAAVLREISPALPTPPARDASSLRVIDVQPVPVLHLDSWQVASWSSMNGTRGRSEAVDHATVSFEYGGIDFAAGSTTTLVKGDGGELIQVRRRSESEQARQAELKRAGLKALQTGHMHAAKPWPQGVLGLEGQGAWPEFMRLHLPDLRTAGWRVEMTEGFRFNVIEIDAIDGRIVAAADGWFDLEMGIVVADRKVRLEPLLAELFRRDRRWLSGGLEEIPDKDEIDLRGDRGERIRIQALRLKPVVRVLVDLFDGLDNAGMRVFKLDAGRLEALSDTGRWEFHGEGSIQQLARRLREAGGVGSVPTPSTLKGELRAYQQQGLSWMQFLREQGLCGVLADDMGLGKTVQTLAHLLAEKEAGRLDRPALIVVPTSLVHNWIDEAKRFAPSLRVLSLQGLQRKNCFEQIADHDLVLTTYALLWRDQEALAKHPYHLLILDEAQFVKNANTRSASAIRELQARHRLCLSGTPLENHLGELWSLFDFLLPGFLGSQKDFAKRWRTPIEKGGDSVRRDLLAKRIRPFMLRRRKDEVTKDLPAKTTIVRNVDLEGAQRDLYETVRTAMQEKVRAAIAEQGFNRSQIVVLDAMLKLRQVCCDPRLINLPSAKKVNESAKLEMLMGMLRNLLDEGRRVLVFSQFTGMLALIAQAAESAGMPFVTLTGDTTDRATPVRIFQSGEIPLFLISLKAGGVGLNLTAADTVIHYDPWWNPAAENQATDRAHRLGQDKPVFVYKLIVAGSIEEKIVSLQEKKAALVEGILSQDASGAVKFSAEDLDALFEAMPTAG